MNPLPTPTQTRALREQVPSFVQLTGRTEGKLGHRMVRLFDTAGRLCGDLFQAAFSGAVALPQIPLSIIGYGQTLRLVDPETTNKNLLDVTELPKKVIDNFIGLIFAKTQEQLSSAYKNGTTLKSALTNWFMKYPIVVKYNKEGSPITNYIATRMSYAVGLGILAATSVVDAAAAPFAVVLSIISFRKFEGLNNYAYRAFVQTPLIINDLFHLSVNAFSPSYLWIEE